MPPREITYQVLYDGQCEVCQSCLAWLKTLDGKGRAREVALENADLASLHSGLDMTRCLEQLHVVDSSGKVFVGWDACVELARLSPWTWPIARLGRVVPFSWLGAGLYRWVASNRYMISKCRGGACRASHPGRVRAGASFFPFWFCYFFGLLVRLPLSAWHGSKIFLANATDWARTFRRRYAMLNGKLTVLFIGGWLPDLVPLIFGEKFCAILYQGVMLDPGSPKMRRSLRRHFQQLEKNAVKMVVATHHHEEHVGNLEFAARHFNAPVLAWPETALLLKNYPRLPWVRSFIIGPPENIQLKVGALADGATLPGTSLVIYHAPGHCNDQIVLYDAGEKLLLAGDAFMGSYFSTPNPDVDSCLWIQSLERLLKLDIEILVEGHGHIHTLSPNIPDCPGVVVRRNPMEELEQKLAYLKWIRRQIEAGVSEGLPPRAIEATCFPWTSKRVWESFAADKLSALLSGGQFSHRELIRSFVRKSGDGVFPEVFELKIYR